MVYFIILYIISSEKIDMSNSKIVQKSPYVIKYGRGRYTWCVYGEFSKQPYCDGSHKGTEFSPIIVNLEEYRNVAWCGFKQTSISPYCDGTHSKL